MRKLAGWVLFAAGAWMLVSPQALIGLTELRWMHALSFSGEALAGIALLAAAYYLLDLRGAGAPAGGRRGSEER